MDTCPNWFGDYEGGEYCFSTSAKIEVAVETTIHPDYLVQVLKMAPVFETKLPNILLAVDKVAVRTSRFISLVEKKENLG